jgi:catechol 2,3-dioxygenase-like lactoylglutathione lyase family enzyme
MKIVKVDHIGVAVNSIDAALKFFRDTLGLIDEALKELEAKGVRLIDKVPRMGAGGKKIAFLHPKDTNGVLVELCQKI